MENLFTDQKLLSLVIISFILMTTMCDSGLILWEEIRCWSLLELKGLKQTMIRNEVISSIFN